MRPGFMVIVIIIIMLSFIVLFSIIDFVLTNRVMFETTFDIIIKVPGWSHTWEGVQFMYILAGSFLLGALVIAIITLGLDTKRTFKLRNMRKELRRLQESLQNAQQSLQEKEVELEEEQPPVVEEEIDEEPIETTDSASVTPEEITKSFEDTVQKNDFLEKSEKSYKEEQEDEDEIREEKSDIWRREDTVTEEVEGEQEPPEEKVEDSTLDRDQELLEETPVEAEVIESEELAEEQESETEISKQEKEDGELNKDNLKKKDS
jgi:DNA-binding protein YbaB